MAFQATAYTLTDVLSRAFQLTRIALGSRRGRKVFSLLPRACYRAPATARLLPRACYRAPATASLQTLSPHTTQASQARLAKEAGFSLHAA
jgi:hypothetical protein